jgi:putative nucleotidyltransferase with HDIG domain
MTKNQQQIINSYCNYQHSKQVAYYSAHLGAIMRLSENEICNLYFGGIFHDIGKNEIDTTLLSKKNISDEEMNCIRSHVRKGISIFDSFFTEKKQIRDIIRYHHERQDGQGYPFQVPGDEIPLLAKIIQICDVFDAMTADRKYRRKKTEREAYDEIEKHIGTQFDADVFHQFTKMYRSTRVLGDRSFETIFENVI